MLSPELVTFLESGGGLVVGSVGADGAPRASRAWGVDVVDAEVGRLRVLVPADDAVLVDHLRDGGRVSVTSADVRTLRSAQVKGEVRSLAPATLADRERVQRYCDEFFSIIVELDGIARSRLERLVPTRFAACEVEVDEVFDQTPGPGAGARLGGAS